VRSDFKWILFYLLGGAAWLQLGLLVLSSLGISTRDDVLERQNLGAAWVVYGMLIGTAFCYAGANIGNGPGPEAVFFCAILPTISLFSLWFCLEHIFHLADRITIERNENAGMRSGAWLASLGLVLGAAVVGGWESLEKTVWDFLHSGWIPLVFFFAAAATEWSFKSRTELKSAERIGSAAIAASYIIAALLFVAWKDMR
jgi:hypothetical protein